MVLSARRLVRADFVSAGAPDIDATRLYLIDFASSIAYAGVLVPSEVEFEINVEEMRAAVVEPTVLAAMAGAEFEQDAYLQLAGLFESDDAADTGTASAAAPASSSSSASSAAALAVPVSAASSLSNRPASCR